MDSKHKKCPCKHLVAMIHLLHLSSSGRWFYKAGEVRPSRNYLGSLHMTSTCQEISRELRCRAAAGTREDAMVCILSAYVAT